MSTLCQHFHTFFYLIIQPSLTPLEYHRWPGKTLRTTVIPLILYEASPLLEKGDGI